MKKIISIFLLFALFALLIFPINSYAAPLGTIDVKTDKTTVRPGEEVKVTIDFGEDLGAYTMDIAYDNNIFEYISAEGGTPNDTSDKVRVVFYDSSGGTSSSRTMSVTFKAKSDITTSNPTEFSITGEGLANSDASVNYDDITIPIVKNVTVEPQYIDYTLNIEHSGEIISGEEISMKISYSSPMGRYYEKARLVAEATTPSGANVQLIGKDTSNLDHDIIQSGWGDSQGYKIGGKDVEQILDVKGKFSQVGDYTITLKLIDRENSDAVIAQKEFSFTAIEKQTTTTPEGNTNTEGTTNNNTQNSIQQEEIKIDENTQKTPEVLPKTGRNIYIALVVVIIALLSSYIYFNKKIGR